MIFRPSWFCSPRPQANTYPVVVSAMKWSFPVAICTIECDERAGNAIGVNWNWGAPGAVSNAGTPSTFYESSAVKTKGEGRTRKEPHARSSPRSEVATPKLSPAATRTALKSSALSAATETSARSRARKEWMTNIR